MIYMSISRSKKDSFRREKSMSVSLKGKRKHIYNNETYYWFVRKNGEGIPRIHIISDDKKIHLERAMFDTEVPVTGAYINILLDEYFKS